ncbi:MAG: DUF3179 domain-containing protein [Pseudomonadota bacterium]
MIQTVLKHRITLAFSYLMLGVLSTASAQMFKHAWPNTNFEQTSVEWSEIMSGGPPRDGIPPIDAPNFDTVTEAEQWVADSEPVIVVSVDDDARAYPLQIMTWHEIVNDSVGGVPLSITFCPLCNASIVFDRRLDGNILDFGTTGLLRKSDLVMWDRQTESWWQQFAGEAIVGDQLGKTLQRYPSSIVAFHTFREAHPNGKVLNRDTGHRRAYGENPYQGYDDIDNNPFLLREPVDGRLPAMERVIGVKMDDDHTIYPFSLFDETSLIEDDVNGHSIVVFKSGELNSALDAQQISGSRMVPEITAFRRNTVSGENALRFSMIDGVLRDQQTGSEWNAFGRAIKGPMAGDQLMPVDSGVHFAFAWLAFNPDTRIYSNE